MDSLYFRNMYDNILKKSVPSRIMFLYIFKEILLYCGIAFLFFFVIFFVNNILANIQSDLIKNVSLLLILKFMFLSTPIIIATAVPYATFIGTLLCFGRFVTDFEIISMNSLGLSSKAILLPTLVVGMLISIFNFFVNDLLIPFSAVKLNEVQVEMMVSTPALEMESYSIKKNDDAVIVTGLVDGNNVNQLLIVDTSDNDSISFVSSKKAELKKSHNPGVVMSINFYEPLFFRVDKKNKSNYDVGYGEALTYNILLKDIHDQYMSSIGPGQMTSYDLHKEIIGMKLNPNVSKRRLNWFMLEFHKKFAIPFGAFFFILLAYSLSNSVKFYNQGFGFVVGILISVVYWAIFMSGQEISVKKDVSGILTMWLPNFLLLLISLLLLWKKAWK